MKFHDYQFKIYPDVNENHTEVNAKNGFYNCVPFLQIMTVFKYIEDKDVFQKFYSKMLAKRLVHVTILITI